MYPVYLTDKRRDGNVKAFTALSDSELKEYHNLHVEILAAILQKTKPHLLHANHLVYQPVVCREAVAETRTPFVIYPHGSSIEYVVRRDHRYIEPALASLKSARGVISGSHEMLDRIAHLFPEQAAVLEGTSSVVGVGVDTTLFTLVPRNERRSSIANLRLEGNYFGRGPSNQTALEQTLCEDSLSSLSEDRGGYDPAVPDQDLFERLDRIDWDAPVVLFVGALTSGKGVQSLIAAFPLLLREVPNATLLIVGSGAYREVLQAFVLALSRGDEDLI